MNEQATKLREKEKSENELFQQDKYLFPCQEKNIALPTILAPSSNQRTNLMNP